MISPKGCDPNQYQHGHCEAQQDLAVENRQLMIDHWFRDPIKDLACPNPSFCLGPLYWIHERGVLVQPTFKEQFQSQGVALLSGFGQACHIPVVT